MRLFSLAYPNLLAREIHHSVRDKSLREAGKGGRPAVAGRGVLNPDLSWTHYQLLTKVESPLARDFYEIEAARNHWSSRELERQINSLLFERLAITRDGRKGTCGTFTLRFRPASELPRRFGEVCVGYSASTDPRPLGQPGAGRPP
jgi:hypothetical protein